MPGIAASDNCIAAMAASDPPRRISTFLIVVQDAQSRAVEILELPRPGSPEERRQAEQPKPQRNRHQNRQDRHFAAPRSRSALATTTSDDPDIASAAISGVTSPAIARGTASRL